MRFTIFAGDFCVLEIEIDKIQVVQKQTYTEFLIN